jgi:SAM-dependent methyltransferase
MSKQISPAASLDVLARLQPLLECLSCRHDLTLEPECFQCRGCGSEYPIIDGIPRFVPEQFHSRTEQQDTLQEKTKNYFGFEWETFKDWGFIPDEAVEADRQSEVYGGTVSARRSAFDRKCRLDADDLAAGNVVLDAGCGNGRYTYEAAQRGQDALVIGVDIGYGSVRSAFANNRDNPNVIILQASLFELPFKAHTLDSCFSNGVLMHTGDAHRAFREIARCIKPSGSFVAHVYHRLNPIWEFNDAWIRSITTRLSIEQNMALATMLAALARQIDRIPGLLKRVNYVVRLLSTRHHMFDWYSAPVASHHTYPELLGWFEESGFEVRDHIPPRMKFFHSVWGINLKGYRQAAS